MTPLGLRVCVYVNARGSPQPSLPRHGRGQGDALGNVKWKVSSPQEVKMIYGLLLEERALKCWIMKSVQVTRQGPLLSPQTFQTFQLSVATMMLEKNRPFMLALIGRLMRWGCFQPGVEWQLLELLKSAVDHRVHRDCCVSGSGPPRPDMCKCLRLLH